MYRILIISLDVVSENMAGPAIRCWEFARALSHDAAVTLAIPNSTALQPDEFTLLQYGPAKLKSLASENDLIILSGHTLWFYPFLRDLDVPLVVDIYDPFLLESLPLLAGLPEAEQVQRQAIILDALTDLLTWGDFFVCASEKQRDYWLGWLNALGRVNPATYQQSPDLRSLIDVVPFGLPKGAPTHDRPVLKGVYPGISAGDKVLLWGGGVYNWFDPLTLIRAMERVSAQRQDVKLFFLGVRHPTHGDQGADMVRAAMALSQDLGLLGKIVFFNDWVPYQDRHNYLLEADLGLSLHFAHMETHFSFRTRLLDYIWAGLPMVVTKGDVLSHLVESAGLGWTVGYEDLDGITDAILQGLSVGRDTFRDRFASVAQELTWEQVLQPLAAFCQAPRPAADRHLRHADLRALPALKLTSLVDAFRRDLDKKDERIADLNMLVRQRESQIANLEARITNQDLELEAIRQGRVMRLMNRFDRLIKGSTHKDV